MKRKISILFSILAGFIFLSSSILMAEEETKTYSEKDFTAVSVGWGMKLKVTQSSNYSVEVKASKKDFQYLKVEKSGKKLKIYIDKNNFHKDGDIYVSISMPSLEGLSLSGGSQSKFNFDNGNKDFVAELSGGSEVNGNLKCANVYLELSGGSELSLKGSGKDLKVEGSGGSEVKMKEFSVKDVTADFSGGSEMQITMDGKINCDLSGGSEIIYWGTAILGNTDFSGGSSISQGD